MLIVVVALLYLFVPMLDAVGAALAIFVARVGFLVVQEYILRRKFPKLKLHNSHLDSIIVPVVLALFVLVKNIPFGGPVLYLLAFSYLVSLSMRNGKLLLELVSDFFVPKEVQTS